MGPSDMTKKFQFSVRKALEGDIAQIRDIFSFYVLNTTISFMLHDPPLSYMKQRFKTTIERDLPYYVAVDTHDDSHIFGFCHATPFSGDKAGYATALDFSLFVHPDRIAMGAGNALLQKLVDHLERIPYYCFERDGDQRLQVYARHLYAITSADIWSNASWTAKGQANWEWYGQKFGFKEVGKLPGIGSKFGQSIDVVYMMKEIVPASS